MYCLHAFTCSHTWQKKHRKLKWLFFGESKNGCSKGTFLSLVLHHTETYAWFSKQRENGMSEKGNQPTNQLVAVLHRVKDLRCHVLMDLYGYMHCNKKNKHTLLYVCATNFNPFVLAKDLHNFSEITFLDWQRIKCKPTSPCKPCKPTAGERWEGGFAKV